MTKNIIQVKMHDGNIINVIENDLISNDIIKNGVFDGPLCQLIEKVVPCTPNPVCLDIGSNIGAISLTMCKYAKQVISFEPIPFIHNLLNKTLSDNKISNCITKNIALSEKKGQGTLYVNPENLPNIGSSSMHHQNKSGQSIDIRLEQGDNIPEIINAENINFIKIDVEGHEPNVIRGLCKTIAKHQPVMAIEWNCSTTRTGFEKYHLFTTILSNYKTYELTTRQGEFRKMTRKYKLFIPFKIIMRLIYKLLTTKEMRNTIILKDGFNKQFDYQNIILVPASKSKQVLQCVAKNS